jgi:hypothetical protein
MFGLSQIPGRANDHREKPDNDERCLGASIEARRSRHRLAIEKQGQPVG